MIALRRAAERQHDKIRKLETWLTFDPKDRAGLRNHGLDNIEGLNESRLAPGARVARASGHDAEILTYVHEGALAYESSLSSSSIVQAGEFQRVTGYDLRREWSAEMDQLTERGWGNISSDNFQLTPQGLRFADTAAEMFLR